MKKSLPITKDGILLLAGDFCWSIEKDSDPFGPKDNVVCRIPRGYNTKGLRIATYEGLGGPKIQHFRLISECYSSREIEVEAKNELP